MKKQLFLTALMSITAFSAQASAGAFTIEPITANDISFVQIAVVAGTLFAATYYGLMKITDKRKRKTH